MSGSLCKHLIIDTYGFCYQTSINISVNDLGNQFLSFLNPLHLETQIKTDNVVFLVHKKVQNTWEKNFKNRIKIRVQFYLYCVKISWIASNKNLALILSKYVKKHSSLSDI